MKVVEARGLAGAADRLGRTPGAVSMSLRELEDRLGGRLFETDRKTQLTPLGSFVYDQARRSVETHDRAISEIERFTRGEAGLLRIAAVPSIATKLLPPVFEGLKRRMPGLRLELRDIDSAAVAAAVGSGEADLGLASAPAEPLALTAEPFLEDHFVAVCRRDSALAQLGRDVSWGDLLETPFIANGLCEALGGEEARMLVANAALRIRNVWSLMAFVEAGHGVTLLPTLATPESETLVALPLPEPAPRRVLSILQRRGETLPPATEMLCAELRRVAQNE